MAQRLSVGGRTLGIVLGALTALALYSQAAGAEGKRDEGRARRDPSGESARDKGEQRKQPLSEADPFAAPAARFAPATEARKEPTRQSEARDRPAAQRAKAAIEAALAQPTSLEFNDEPLSNIVDYLKDYHRIEIMLDQAILEEVGFDPGKQMTVNLKGISLESALDLILRQEGLVWTICDEIFLITTPEERDNLPMTTELYPVGDLVERRDEEGGSHDDYKTLVKLIVSHVARTSWAEAGGPGTITGATFGSAKVLVVTHDYRVHRQIEGLLERIRAEGRQPASEGKPATRRRP